MSARISARASHPWLQTPRPPIPPSPTPSLRQNAAFGPHRAAVSAATAGQRLRLLLADLDSARSNAAIVLGELDTLYTAATVQAEDATAIVEARNTVIALVSEEDSVLERLRAQVR